MTDYIINLPRPYSGALIFFWCITAGLAWLGLVFEAKPWVSRFNAWSFWVLALILIFVAVLRPIGIAPDDLAYLGIYNGICSSAICEQWIQGSRDWGWYSTVGLLKSLWDSPRNMLLVAGFSAAIKLWVIFKLSRNPLMALMCFVAIFYPVQDITALRVSFALSIYMLAIYWLSNGQKIIGSLSVFVPMLAHSQAILSPIVLFADSLRKRYFLFVCLALVPIALVLLGMAFKLYQVVAVFQDTPVIKFLMSHGLSAYVVQALNTTYKPMRDMPYSYIPLVFLIVCFSIDLFRMSKNLYIYSAMSFIVACWSLWVFAGWEEPQVRFFEYFALPSLLLVGNFRASLFPFLSVVLVSGVFIVRYNLLHPLFLG